MRGTAHEPAKISQDGSVWTGVYDALQVQLLPTFGPASDAVTLSPGQLTKRADDQNLSQNDGAASEELSRSIVALQGAFPNPFNPITNVQFSVGRPERVALEVFDARGRLVRTLRDDVFPPGDYSVVWDGRTDSNRATATGVYYLRLSAGGIVQTERVVLLK